MNSEALKNLPPEMQAASCGNYGNNSRLLAASSQGLSLRLRLHVAAIVKPPSLMDHLIALRGEVAEMRNEVGFMRQEMANLSATIEANSNVVEAVGQATGQIYQMFQANTQSKYNV